MRPNAAQPALAPFDVRRVVMFGNVAVGRSGRARTCAQTAALWLFRRFSAMPPRRSGAAHPHMADFSCPRPPRASPGHSVSARARDLRLRAHVACAGGAEIRCLAKGLFCACLVSLSCVLLVCAILFDRGTDPEWLQSVRAGRWRLRCVRGGAGMRCMS
jgi:hypothetical protein